MSIKFIKSPIHIVGYPVAIFIAVVVTYLFCDDLLQGKDKLTIIGSAFGVSAVVSTLLFGLDSALDRKSGQENSPENNNQNDSS